ncbi:helix-turn-helix transcriptional regulator [Metabacillus fastidiosus]|uniref:helix-turn-helix domain-containing protein n=1 Tax=Metabacillus fastidiosus TaxID=1458 RepID=UPI002E21D6E9|nr:helix-turn-helix transcriptional regulator [Metabacillus fastidiosus]
MKALQIRNNLNKLMAERGINSIAELQKLENLGNFDQDTIYRFANNLHKDLDTRLLAAVCKDLNCDLGDVIYTEKTICEL